MDTQKTQIAKFLSFIDKKIYSKRAQKIHKR